MEATIRPATPTDIDTLVELSRQLNQDDPSSTGGVLFDAPAVRAALQQFIGNDSLGQAWLIYDGAEPIGYAILTLGYSLEYHGQDAFVDELFIKATHRGQGIGSNVMNFLEAEARKLGIKALHLEVERPNSRAHKFYRQLGFVDHNRYLLSKKLGKERGPNG